MHVSNILLLLALSAQAATIISTTRNPYRTNICTYFSTNYADSQRTTSSHYMAEYSYLSTQDIETMLYGRLFYPTATPTMLLLLPHAISILVLFILWPCLCCCCVWPEKYPVCQKLRKPEKEMYTRCQMKWTAYVGLVLYLLLGIGSVLAIVSGPDFVNYVNDLGCKMVSVGDDLVYGRESPSVSGRFFVGLSPFSSQLLSFNSSQLPTFYTQSGNALSPAGNVRSKQTIVENIVTATYTNYADITYTNAFSTDGTVLGYTPVNSVFKELFYGPTTRPTSLLGSIYFKCELIFAEVNAVLDPMITSWGRLSSLTQAGISSQVVATADSMSSLSAGILNEINTYLGPLLSNQALYGQVEIGLKALYGAFLVLALLGLVSSLLLACCSVVSTRLILYCTCSFAVFLSFLSFSLLLFFAFLQPNIAQICTYVDAKLATGSGTADLLTRLNMGLGTTATLVTNCMAAGSGVIVDQINTPFSVTFDDINLIASSTLAFNNRIPDYNTANLTVPITAATTTVNSVLNAQLLDINNTVALTFIEAVRTVSYPVGINCILNNVNGDSWFPSTALYSCPAGKATLTPCSNLGSTAAGDCPLGCYQIMLQFESAAGDSSYVTSLAARYNSNCNYYTYITNLQTNWNIPRKSKMQSVQGSLSVIQTNVLNYDTATKAVQAQISTFRTTLSTNYDSTFNPSTGAFNGADCRVVGQSISDMRDSLCIGVLNSVNYNLTCLLLINYSILLLSCFVTSAGVKHFKHLQRMQVRVGYKGVPLSISEQRLTEK